MMTFVLLAIGAYLAFRFLRFAGAAVLAVAAWVGVALVALSVLVGEPVPTGAIVGTLGLWIGSQLISRGKTGAWRSRVLRAVLPV